MIETKIKLRIPSSIGHFEQAVKLFLIASNAKQFSMEYIVGDNESLKLEDEGNVEIKEPILILRYLNQFCLIEQSLVDIPKMEKDIREWIKFSFDMKSPHEAKKLNNLLVTKTYLIGNYISVADIFVLAKLQVFIKEIKDNIPGLFHFGRWYTNLMTYIQLLPMKPDLNITSFEEYLSSPPPFQYIPTDNPVLSQQGGGKKKKKGEDQKKGGGKQKQQPKKKNKKQQQQPAGLSPYLVDIRVGKVISIKGHPEYSGTYVEEVDVGMEKPLVICSGLAGKIPMNDLENKLVLLMVNLKPRKMKSVESQGMLLCGTSKEKVVSLLSVPDGVVVGERIEWINAPKVNPPKVVPGKKFHKMMKKYRSDAEKRVCFDKFVLMTSKGPVLTQESESVVS